MPDALSHDEVAHVARLARLELEDAELETYRQQLSHVLEHVEAVRRLDTAALAPTSHPFALENVLRPDTVAPGVARDEVLAAAPAAEDGRFRVPRILGEAP